MYCRVVLRNDTDSVEKKAVTGFEKIAAKQWQRIMRERWRAPEATYTELGERKASYRRLLEGSSRDLDAKPGQTR